MLSRNVKELARSHNAQAVVTGTYTVGGQFIYVNLRVISVSSGQVLSAIDYSVPLDNDSYPLVQQKVPGI